MDFPRRGEIYFIDFPATGASEMAVLNDHQLFTPAKVHSHALFVQGAPLAEVATLVSSRSILGSDFSFSPHGLTPSYADLSTRRKVFEIIIPVEYVPSPLIRGTSQSRWLPAPN